MEKCELDKNCIARHLYSSREQNSVCVSVYVPVGIFIELDNLCMTDSAGLATFLMTVFIKQLTVLNEITIDCINDLFNNCILIRLGRHLINAAEKGHLHMPTANEQGLLQHTKTL